MGAPIICAALILLISQATAFTTDLIHRSSIQSPSNQSSYEHVQSSLRRSITRSKTLFGANPTLDAVSTDIIPDAGEYLMRLFLGTPKVETLAIADTGSDLTWIQCKPCPVCFKQKAPLFDPSRSSTYKTAACNTPTCDALERTTCSAKRTCTYAIGYGDRSYSRGELATETLTLGSAKINNVIIGCGHNDQGTFGDGTSGIVGLGGGEASLITQLESTIQGKFSYCLVPAFGSSNPGTSKINFGQTAVVNGAGVVKTPIVPQTPDTFYWLTIEGMSVGGQRLNLASSFDDEDYGSGSKEGNIIIDSGTTLTFLPQDLYSKVEKAVRRQMRMRQIRDPAGILSLCYRSSRGSVSVPVITAHFKGADVKLNAANTFVKTTASSLCLAFAPSTGTAIYGNLAQMGFLVGYDLKAKTVSFKQTDCTKG